MEFKDRLKELRTDHQLTQQELADAIGVHVMTISGYERGIRKPDFETLDKIADRLGASFDYLLGAEEVNTGYPVHVETITEGHYDAQMNRLLAYHDRIMQAYDQASPDTQAAVRAILHIEEPKDGDR